MSADTPALRAARLWGDVVDGKPVLDAQLGRADDPAQKARVLHYLNAGQAVLRAPTLLDDEIDPARTRCIPLMYMTDGEWLWSGEHAYYLEAHDILPEPEFLAHMASNDFTVPAVGDEARAEALRLLTPPSP